MNPRTKKSAAAPLYAATEAAVPKQYFLRLSAKEKIMIVKRLSILLKSGMPILKCVNLLKSQAGSKSTAQILEVLAKDVENGQYLHVSLERFRKIFGAFALNLIRIGELSGTLQENLNYLAEELQKQQALRRKVIGALVYPIFIVFATFGITGMLTFYVFPKILPVFQSFKFQLPWTTRVLIFVSSFMLNHGLAILLALVVLVFAVFVAMRQPKIRLWVDRQILRLPLFGQMFLSYHLVSFTRTLGILLKGEALIVEAVRITADTSTSTVYRREFNIMSEKLTHGEKLSEHLATNPKLFPPAFTQMISVGETAGNLSDTLLFLAEMYEAELEEITKNMSSLIEPVLMIFMGVLVGFIALSIITPIYSLTQSLSNSIH